MTIRQVSLIIALSNSQLLAQTSISVDLVANASSYKGPLAPGMVFVVFGKGMGPSSISTAVAPNYPEILSGTSIKLTPSTGAGAINARMVYSLNSQLGAVLPSSVAPGAYELRVSFNGQTSAATTVNVAARSFGIATTNSDGAGLAQATVGNINGGFSLTRFAGGSTTFNGVTWAHTQAHPGDTIILWGTGGGADLANDAGGSSGDQTAAGNFRVDVNGNLITPLYAGTSTGYPGLWQINFKLPGDTTPDCFAVIRVKVQIDPNTSVESNRVTIPVADVGQNSCSDVNANPAIFSKLDAGESITFGTFAITKQLGTNGITVFPNFQGTIAKWTPLQWINNHAGVLFGSCRLHDSTFIAPASSAFEPIHTYLDAGPSISLEGPNLLQGFTVPQIGAASSFLIYSTSEINPANGTYILRGTGGKNVAALSATTVFPDSFSVPRYDRIPTPMIDRTEPLTINWTGNGIKLVRITVSTAQSELRGFFSHYTVLSCVVPAEVGTYTIPIEALSRLLPAESSGPNPYVGMISLVGFNQTEFNAGLLDGGKLDMGTFVGEISLSRLVKVQ